MKVTQAKLKSYLHYDPVSGIFTNLVSRERASKYSRAGTIHTIAGYRYITIEGKKYAEHQWAFLYMLGRMPFSEIDHADGNTGNNRWSNLREADRFKNLANSRPHSKGLKGTSLTVHGTWCARIRANGKNYHLGCFSTEQEAHAAYIAKAQEIHGEFARAA